MIPFAIICVLMFALIIIVRAYRCLCEDYDIVERDLAVLKAERMEDTYVAIMHRSRLLNRTRNDWN